MFTTLSIMDSFKKRTATKNKIHGEEVLGIPSKLVYRSLKENKKHLDKELKGIEQKLLILVKQDQQATINFINCYTWNRHEDSLIFNYCYRRFYKV